MISISYFQRKRFPNANYSSEFIFEDVRFRLGNRINPKICISPFHSKGFIKRIVNILVAYTKQSNVNHITGDIHYISYLLSKRKTILTVLDCGFLVGKKKLKFYLLKWFWLDIPVSRVKYITAISEFTKQQILKYTKCDESKIVVIPVAISSDFIYSYKEFDSANIKLLQIGAAPNKNLTRIIKAIVDLHVTLDIIGPISEFNLALLKSNKIAYNSFINLTRIEVIERYKNSDILIFPSTHEGFGMPILEAQKIGRPVITSNISSMPEVAGNGACFVDPFSIESIREGVLKVINNEGYRMDLITKGLENVKKYDPEVIANQYYDLYTKIDEIKN